MVYVKSDTGIASARVENKDTTLPNKMKSEAY